MTQALINVGTFPNDATGDPAQTAFIKINNNFSQLFGTSSGVTFGPPPTPPGGTPVTIVGANPANAPTLVINTGPGISTANTGVLVNSDSIGFRQVSLTTAGFSYIRLDDNTASRQLEILHIGSAGSTTYGAAAGTSVINSFAGITVSTNDLARMVINATGNVTIAAPSGGTALTVAGTLALTGQTAANIGILPVGAGAVNQPAIQYFSDNNLYIDAPITGTPHGGQTLFRTSVGTGSLTTCMTLGSGGNVTIGQPSSSTGLKVSSGISVTGGNVLGASDINVGAGQGIALNGANSGQIIQYTFAGAVDNRTWDTFTTGPILNFRAIADNFLTAATWLSVTRSGITITDINLAPSGGGVTIGSPTGGDKGAGTLNCTGLFVNGVAVTVP